MASPPTSALRVRVLAGPAHRRRLEQAGSPGQDPARGIKDPAQPCLSTLTTFCLGPGVGSPEWQIWLGAQRKMSEWNLLRPAPQRQAYFQTQALPLATTSSGRPDTFCRPVEGQGEGGRPGWSLWGKALLPQPWFFPSPSPDTPHTCSRPSKTRLPGKGKT